MSKTAHKVLVQFDGSNFYRRSKQLSPETHLTHFNYLSFAKMLSFSDNPKIVYYVGEIRREMGNEKSYKLYSAQQTLLEHLRKQEVEIKLGYLLKTKDVYHEKGVDVQIAADMIQGATKSLYDSFYLISSDTDLLPAIKIAQQEGKQVCYVGFSNFISKAMKNSCNSYRLIKKIELEKFEFSRRKK